MLGRIGVIGDIHSQNRALRAAIGLLQKLDLPIFCTGDVVDGDGDVHECIRLLTENRIATVLGNHDEWMLKGLVRDPIDVRIGLGNITHATKIEELSGSEVAFVRSLPRTLPLSTVYGNILLCHGVGENNMNKVNPDDYGYSIEVNDDLQKLIVERKHRLIINGHSHKKMVKDISGLVIVNAGALTRDPGFLVIDFSEQVVHFHVLHKSGSKVEMSTAF